MKLYRKNNIVIINAMKHKGAIEEKHSRIETQGLVKTREKPTWGKPLKFFFLLDCH